MNREDIYTRDVDVIAERYNHRLSKFTNVPTKDINGICYIFYEGSDMKETWCPERDWNQLMLIVDEIEKIDKVEVIIKGSFCHIVEKASDTLNISILCKSESPSRLESVYRCCVDFVNNVAIR
jgi:hypothetical protein